MKSLRIAVWNLERPGASATDKKDRQIAKMKEVKADIWIVTETHESMCLPGYSAIWSKRAPNYHRRGEACAAILSRHPMRGPIPVLKEDFAVCAAIEAGETLLLVHASVIPYANYKGPDNTSGRWVEHKKHIGFNRTDWMRLRREYPAHALVAGGDFNQCLDRSGWYGNDESERLLNMALDDAGLECATALDLRKSGALTTRATVDHICLSRGLSRNAPVVDAWEGGNRKDPDRLSDHNGVHVTFEIA